MANDHGGGFAGLIARVAETARQSGVFGEVRVAKGRLECDALASAEAAQYRLEHDRGSVWAALVMADRWLSESIEADLMHSGDKIEELLEEELVELGYEGEVPGCEHFRSDDMLFTFRTRVPLPGVALDSEAAAAVAAVWLRAYEACFAQLGDMSGGEDE